MVNRLRTLAVFGVAAAALLWLAPSAGADINSGQPPAQGSGYNAVGTSQASAGYGTTAHSTSGACSLYANATSFGESCLGGAGGGGTPPSVVSLLGGDPKDAPKLLPICWDEPINEADWAGDTADHSAYPANMPEYTLTCLNNLTLANSVYNQPNLAISQVIVAPPPNTPCGTPPLSKEDQLRVTSGQCLETLQSLTPGQQKVVSGFDDQLNTGIPTPVIETFPALDHVRTQTPSAFRDSGEPAKNAQGYIQTKTIDEGRGVAMFARMDPSSFVINPGDGTGPITCADPFQPLQAGATPQNSPESCWHTYTKNSFDQPGRVYTVTASVQWTVYANGNPLVDQGDHHKATFTEVDTVKLEVDDVQTLVIGNS